MAFESLQENIKEKFQSIGSKIRESQSYNELVERYQDLSPKVQKILFYLGLTLLLLLIFAYPLYSFYSSSRDLSQHNKNLYLVSELKKNFYKKSELKNMPQKKEMFQIQGDIRSRLENLKLLPEQIDMQSYKPETKSLFPPGVEAQGLKLRLSNINMEQFTRVSMMLKQLHPNIIIGEVQINKSTDAEKPEYQNAKFEIINYYVDMGSKTKLLPPKADRKKEKPAS